MAKAYIDVPVIGYETWLIQTGIIIGEKFYDDDNESNLIEELRKRFPFSPENKHVK